MARIAILDLTTVAPELAGLNTAGETIRNWLSMGLSPEQMEIVPIAGGVSLPDVSRYDAYVISGSEKGVYDDTPWMAGMRRFLLSARDAGKPLFGICFGHQLMADTFGGRAELSGHGMRVGPELFEYQGRMLQAHVWHQDHVTEVPPQAQIVGSAAYCPAFVLQYDFPAASIQFHPELEKNYFKACLERLAGNHLSEDEAKSALERLSGGNVAEDLFVSEAVNVLSGGRLVP